MRGTHCSPPIPPPTVPLPYSKGMYHVRTDYFARLYQCPEELCIDHFYYDNPSPTFMLHRIVNSFFVPILV